MDWSIPSSFEQVRQLRSSPEYALFKAFDTSRSEETLVWCVREHDTESLDKAIQLRQPQFARILGRGHSQSNAYVTQAVPEGRPLSELLGSSASVPIGTLTNIALQLSLSLTIAHRNGLFLSNVSLENCYLSQDQKLQIIGLGIGSIAANPQYSSPEAKDNGAPSVPSDIFSIGSLLYELAVGFPPFAGDSGAELDRAIAYQPPPRIAPVRKDLASLEAILSRCLTKSPEERFQSASDLTEALIAQGPQQTQTTTRRRPALAWVLAALGAGVAMTLAFNYVGTPAPNLGSRKAGALDRWTTVALMPIEHHGELDDSQQARLLQGIEDVIVGTLASNTPLTVISTLSTRVYLDSQKPMPQIADELGADALLETSVLHSSDATRLQLRCSDVETGGYTWERTLELPAANIVEVQNLIEAALYAEFESVWMGSHDQMLRASTTEAYGLFLEGRHLSRKHTSDAARRAVEILKQAVTTDANFAPGWAALSRAYSNLVNFDEARPDDWIVLAEGAAEKAIEQAPSLPDGYSARGVVEVMRYFYLGQGDRRLAEQDFERALARSGDYPDALLNKAFLLTSRGIVDNDRAALVESLSFYERALRLQPNLPKAVANYAMTLSLTGQDTLARSRIERALEVTPSSVLLHSYLANIAYVQHDFAKALDSAEKVLNFDPSGRGLHQLRLASFLAASGAHERAESMIQESSPERLSPSEIFHLASTMAGLERRAEALRCLEIWSEKTPPRSEQRGQFRWWFENDPNLEKLREDGSLNRYLPDAAVSEPGRDPLPPRL